MLLVKVSMASRPFNQRLICNPDCICREPKPLVPFTCKPIPLQTYHMASIFNTVQHDRGVNGLLFFSISFVQRRPLSQD